jgi:hypothetical protein
MTSSSCYGNISKTPPQVLRIKNIAEKMYPEQEIAMLSENKTMHQIQELYSLYNYSLFGLNNLVFHCLLS